MRRFISLFIAIVMLAAAFAAAIPASAASTGFSDVEDGRWSADSIQYAVINGYMKGVGDGKFDPEGPLTRAMVATVLWRREDSPAPAAPSGFDDVPAGEWYTDAVAWAKETGVVKGLTETTFGPDEYITREQLGTMLFRFSSSAPVSVPERADLSPFADGEKVSEWAEEPLEWAVEAGLLKGTDGNRLAPDGYATREQFAAIIERYDGSFKLAYNAPVLRSSYTEPEYPLVKDADYYVSPSGSDENDGSFDHPFGSFNKAAEAVRELKKTKSGDITVAFMAGQYGPLSVTLTEEDSGSENQRITYCKYGDGDVVFNNGFDFPVDSFAPISEDERAFFGDKAADAIKKVDIASVVDAVDTLDDLIIYDRGGLLTEARFPDKYEDGTDQLLFGAAYGSKSSLKIINPVLARRIAKYGEAAYGRMGIWGYIIRGYRKDAFRVAGYDPETAILEIANWETSEFGVMRDWMGLTGNGIELCVTNVSYELDHAGEYWIDPETATLYVYAPDGDCFIPSGGVMIAMDNVNDVTFRGLTFKNSAGGFIDASMCHGASLELCSFLNTSAIKGVIFTDNSPERAMDLTVRECTFANAYGHALYVDGNNRGEHLFDKREDIVFDNNLVRTTNMVYDAWNGIHFKECAGVNVTHNRFEDCSRGAVSFGSSYDVLVEYNDFDSAMCDSHDGGVIYTDWIVFAGNCVVRYNYFGRVPKIGAGQYGLYLDEFSSNFEIYGNLFFHSGNCAAMFSLGRDNVFRNNAVISGPWELDVGWGAKIREEIDEAGGTEELAFAKVDNVRAGTKIWGEFFENLKYPGYRAVIEERWPEKLDLHLDYGRIDDENFAFNQTTLIKGNAYFDMNVDAYRTWNKYEEMYSSFEDNTGYTLDENPLFVNPTRGDYRIREGAGFPDIEFEKIGRY